jgi:putative transcriptional regulator
MLAIIETETLQRYAAEIWRDSEREAFICWLADNPFASEVIPGTGGLRKVRWRRFGLGKRGGARVIYYNVLDHAISGCLSPARRLNSTIYRWDSSAGFAKRWNVDKEMEQFQADLLKSVRDMKTGRAARVTRVEPTAAALARSKVGLSQSAFAALLGVSTRTLQDWEQGRRQPTGAAQTLLRVAMAHPEALRDLQGA